MGRKAKIIGVCRDIFDDAWECRDAIFAPCGIMCWQGWPAGQDRGRGGCGRPRWIITKPLADWIEFHALDYRKHLSDLPFRRFAADRLRRLMGVSCASARLAWWKDREADLLTMGNKEFCQRHGFTDDMATFYRKKLGHDNLRYPPGWYLLPKNIAILTSESMPFADMADHFGLSVRTIWQLRHLLRTQHGFSIADRRGGWQRGGD